MFGYVVAENGLKGINKHFYQLFHTSLILLLKVEKNEAENSRNVPFFRYFQLPCLISMSVKWKTLQVGRKVTLFLKLDWSFYKMAKLEEKSFFSPGPGLLQALQENIFVMKYLEMFYF